MSIKIKNNKKGFSIGEVILSVFILGVVMLVIMSILSLSLREMMDERDNVTAIMLAQEGVELARNIRDSNWADRVGVADPDPLVFDNFPNGDRINCRIDYLSTDISNSSCDNGTNHKILKENGGFYEHTNGTNTKFRRRIVLTYDGGSPIGADYLIVASLVSWNNINPPSNSADCEVASKCVFSEATLTDWGTGL